MLPKFFIPGKKITFLLLAIVISAAILLLSCTGLPAPSPAQPAQPATPEETPATPVQPPVKPQAPPSPAPAPPVPTPLPSPPSPPAEEKPPGNGIVKPQVSTTTDGGGNKLFLNIAGISGESIDDKHADWIDVLSFSHGISQPAGTSDIIRSTERSEHMDFIITKELDKSSPKLALFCCNGTHVTEVVIEVCRADTSEKYMQYTLTDVIVSSISQSGSSQDSARPVEEVSLRYGRIDWSYTETDYMTGKPKGNVEAYWDVETNKGG